MKCPSCGAEASGKFCSSCGSPLEVGQCPSCGATVPAGAKFCTSCGEALPERRGKSGAGVGKAGAPGGPEGGKADIRKGGTPGPARARIPGGAGVSRGPEGARGSGNTLAWWVAGALLVVAIVALGLPILTRESPGPGPGQGGMPPGMGGQGSAPAVDLSNMTPEEMATGLFNRVMTSASQGDSLGVATHLPMALSVHEELNPTDPDGLYHFALLHQVAGNHEAALEKARQGLEQVPDHLLHLAVAAESQAALGDTTAAREHYRHLLDVYEAEVERDRPGYDHHPRMLPVYRDEARAFLGQG